MRSNSDNHNMLIHEADVIAAARNPAMQRSTLINRNIMVNGRRTSVRLEPEMWAALLDIARRENQTIHDLAALVEERKKPETSLTAAIRVFCLVYYRSAITELSKK